jgi:hypothetical protein
MSHCCYTVVTPLSHRFHTFVTLLLHCCHTVVTLLSHRCHTVVTLLSHCCHTFATLLLHFCYTVATLLSHYCYTVRFGPVSSACWTVVVTALRPLYTPACSRYSAESRLRRWRWPLVAVARRKGKQTRAHMRGVISTWNSCGICGQDVCPPTLARRLL